MADEQGGKPGEGAPAGSPPQTPPAGGTPAGGGKPEQKDFSEQLNEMLKNPKFSEFWERQIGKKAEAIVSKRLESLNPPKEDEDPHAAELASTFGLDMTEAKKLSAIVQRMADQAADKKLEAVRPIVATTTFNQKMAEFAQGEGHADVFDLQSDMLEALKSEPESVQTALRNGPPEVSIAFLYNKVKATKGGTSVNPNRYAGGSPAGGGAGSARVKDANANDPRIEQAIEAFKKGDRAAYERLAHGVISSR